MSAYRLVLHVIDLHGHENISDYKSTGMGKYCSETEENIDDGSIRRGNCHKPYSTEAQDITASRRKCSDDKRIIKSRRRSGGK